MQTLEDTVFGGYRLVPISRSLGPRGPNLSNSCRRSNLTHQKQYLPMPILTTRPKITNSKFRLGAFSNLLPKNLGIQSERLTSLSHMTSVIWKLS